MGISKRTAVVVGSSVALGLIGDIIIYSIAASKGGKLKLSIPHGKELIQIIVVGTLSGFVLDWAVKKIEDVVKLPEEKKLDMLVEAEKIKVEKGENRGKTPQKVIWA